MRAAATVTAGVDLAYLWIVESPGSTRVLIVALTLAAAACALLVASLSPRPLRAPLAYAGALGACPERPSGPLAAARRRIASSSVAAICLHIAAPCVLALLAFRSPGATAAFLDRPLTLLVWTVLGAASIGLLLLPAALLALTGARRAT